MRQILQRLYKVIELSEWQFIDDKYWVRVDLDSSENSEPYGNNTVGFLKDLYNPRFFGKDVNFLIDKFKEFKHANPSNVKDCQTLMDTFLQKVNDDYHLQLTSSQNEQKKHYMCTYQNQAPEFIEAKDEEDAMNYWVAKLTIRALNVTDGFVFFPAEAKVEIVKYD